MSVMILDAGNSIIKAKIVRRETGKIAFPHSRGQLSECEYQRILSRSTINGVSKDYLKVNEQSYVAGESTERHGVITKRSGAACTFGSSCTFFDS